MYYETMPLYPSLRPGCDPEKCVRVPMFDAERREGGAMGEVRQCRRVTIENPCRPGERAEVLLGLDACGNLVVCVHRNPRWECECEPHRPTRREGRCLPEPSRPTPPCREWDCDPCRPPRRDGRCLPEPSCPPRRGCERGRLYGTWR